MVLQLCCSDIVERDARKANTLAYLLSSEPFFACRHCQLQACAVCWSFPHRQLSQALRVRLDGLRSVPMGDWEGKSVSIPEVQSLWSTIPAV